MTHKKISISKDSKESLEIIFSGKIYTNNIFKGSDKQKISGLLDSGRCNASNYLKRKHFGDDLMYLEQTDLLLSLQSIKKELNLKKLPVRMECYDISHISGTFVYGSMVVFLNGKPAKSYYRLFKLENKNDDFGNLNKVISRRLAKSGSSEAWKLPDLFVIDGGKGQLSAVAKVFEEKHISSNVCSLAKRIEEVFTINGNDFERIILSEKPKFMFQRLRDEAHRFAITSSGKAKLKTSSKSELETLEGVGEVTKLKLLKEFKSVKNLIKYMDKDPERVKLIVSNKVWKVLKKRFG